MGRTAKVTRLLSHTKAKRREQGKSWKVSTTVKVRRNDKLAALKTRKKKLKGQVVRSTEAYNKEAGYSGTFVGQLVKKLGDAWRVEWQDGSVQDGMQERWFERVVSDGGGGWVPGLNPAAKTKT